MAITFDTVSPLGGLSINLDAVTVDYTAQEIYQAWKDWARDGDGADTLWAPKAFDVVGGDDLGAGKVSPPFFFLRNDLGWSIKRPEANIQPLIVGNLLPRDPNGNEIFMGPIGAFTPVVSLELTNVAKDDLLNQLVETGLTLKHAIQIMVAILSGKLSGAATNTEMFRDFADTKDRITATLDNDGNRLTIVVALD